VAQRTKDVDRFWNGGPHDPESNLLFGEGGAGAFSDGKLRTRIGDPLLWTFLKSLVAAGAPDSILWEARPHLGTDGVRKAASGLRALAEGMGAEFRFGAKWEGFETAGGRIRSARVSGERIETGAVVLACGGSARDVFEILESLDVGLERKPFQMGLRIEHHQETIDRMQYGRAREFFPLPPAEYERVERFDHALAPVFSFCMCPGGRVIPAVSEEGHLCTNGMSFSDRAGDRANSALVVTIPADRFGSGALSGVSLQRLTERAGFLAGGGGYAAPAATARAFLAGEMDRGFPATSYPFGVKPADLASLLPDGVGEAVREALSRIGLRVPAFIGSGAVLIGPETRGSSPVRIVRDRESGESATHGGLFPAGEGAGWAGGIASAGVDGLRASLALARRFACPP
jgi:uncharacterized FAD-dependent dehydrogenase